MPLVVDDDERVTRWVAQHSGGGHAPPAYLAVGYEREGELIAGVYFDNCTDTNVFAHIASTAHTLPVEFLAYVAFMAYETLGCKRMTFVVADNNIPCLKLVVGLGAVLEATIKQGHKHGDTYLFALWDTNEFYRRLKRARPAVAEGATSGK